MKIDFNYGLHIDAKVDSKCCRSALEMSGFSTKDKSDSEIIKIAISLLECYGFEISNNLIVPIIHEETEKASPANNCKDLPVI